MTAETVSYSHENGIATICIDDGKRNALSPSVLREIYAALDRAEGDNAIVILTGRDDVFSAGFDLKVMKRGGLNAIRMLRLGYKLPARILAYPRPVIVACNGHVLAMGVFMMLAADYVIGSHGDFKISANEVAIGMTMPRVAAAMLKNRLTPAAYQRAVTLAEYFDVEKARKVGFFDELVEPADLIGRANTLARSFGELSDGAHRRTKRQVRKSLIWQLRRSLPLDLVSAIRQGMR